MIREYHNHKPQTTQWHREEDHLETPDKVHCVPANMPIWVPYGLPIWGVQPGSAWVPYGLAHMPVAQMGPI